MSVRKNGESKLNGGWALVFGFVFLLIGSAALAPARQADAPGFTAVNLSVSKGADSGSTALMMMVSGGNLSGGRAVFTNATFLQLIEAAYLIDRDDRIIGGPAWLGTDHFDLHATASPSSSNQEMQSMLQALLAERFALKVHSETRSFPGYALVPGKGRPKFKPSAVDDTSGATGCRSSLSAPPTPPSDAGGGSPSGPIDFTYKLICRQVTMRSFIDIFSNFLNSGPGSSPPVLDETKLEGAYDLDWDIDSSVLRRGAVSQTDREVAIIKSIQGRLGLDLVKRQIPLQVLVVDGVNEQFTTPVGAAPPLPPPPAEFEVASIKPADPNGPGVLAGGRGGGATYVVSINGSMVVMGSGAPQVTPGGEVKLNSSSLQQMILFAYGMTPDRLLGAPKWLNDERWTLAAKTSPGLIPDDTKGMMRKLLEQRFHLVVHKDTQPVDTYAMTRSDRKVTLKTAGPDERSECKPGHDPNADGPTLTCTATTMAQLADQLPNRAPAYFQQHHAVDLTEISGAYDFTLRWVPAGLGGARGGGGDSGGVAEAATPVAMATTDTIFEAVEKTLGVKIAMAKVPAPVLVIDHVDRTQTEN